MGRPWTDLRYVAVDVEGNGQHPPDLVEVALVPISAGVVGTPMSWLVRPPRPIREVASRVHHIRDADVVAAPTIVEVAAQIRALLDGAVFVAHNAPVDVGVLIRELPGLEVTSVVDTLRLARVTLPGRASYRLGALAADLGLADDLPDHLSSHRATWDALVCARLLVRLAAHMDLASPSGGRDNAGLTLF